MKYHRSSVSGQFARVIDSSKHNGRMPWWRRWFTSEGRRYARWDRSLTDENGFRRGGVFQFEAKRVKR